MDKEEIGITKKAKTTEITEKIRLFFLRICKWFAARGKKKNGALVSDILFTVVFVCYSVFLINTALTGYLRWSEIDSNLLPLLSIQYRGTIVIEQEDIDQAHEDFGGLYEGIETYEDLRSARLVQIDEDHWLAYYYPAFPVACIPLKTIFEANDMDQIRAVTTTSAVFVLAAVGMGYYGLNAKRKTKWTVALLMMASPATYYVNYINYECFVFGMLAISLVLFYNGRKKCSAIALSIASMSNSAVMGVGIIMVIHYIVTLLKRCKKIGIKRAFRRYRLDCILYACSFIPCLIPFVVQNSLLGKSIFSFNSSSSEKKLAKMFAALSTNARVGLFFGAIALVALAVIAVKKKKAWIVTVEGLALATAGIYIYGSTITGYWNRVLCYLFDPTIGFTTFAPFQVLLAFLCIVSLLVRRNWEAFVWPLFVLSAVMAASLMSHMNVGMLLCARYVFWIYPALALFVGLELSYLLRPELFLAAMTLATVASTAAMISYNDSNYYVFYEWTNSAQYILDEYPDRYQPWYSLFAYRTSGGNWYYESQKWPIAYFDSDGSGEVRKLLVWGYKSRINAALDLYCGDGTASEQRFIGMLMNVPLDKQPHYLDFPEDSGIHVRLRELNDWIEKDELQDSDPLIDWQDIGTLPGSGIFYNVCDWITLQKNSVYRIDVELPEQDLSHVKNLVLEFFQPDLDYYDPFITNFGVEGQTTYTFLYTTSPEDWPFETSSKSVMFRIYAITFDGEEDAEILVDSVTVTKLTPSIGYR